MNQKWIVKGTVKRNMAHTSLMESKMHLGSLSGTPFLFRLLIRFNEQYLNKSLD